MPKTSTGGITISYKNKEHGTEETIIAYIKTENFNDMSEHHIVAGRVIKYFIQTKNANKTEILAWIRKTYNINATATRKISKPIHSIYNILFNGENPSNYKPKNVMKKLHKFIYEWDLNDRKKRLAVSKLLVCIFIDLRFQKNLGEENLDLLTEDLRIKNLHKLLRSRKTVRGKQIMKTLKIEYWEVEKYFRNNFILGGNNQEFWDLIPDQPCHMFN